MIKQIKFAIKLLFFISIIIFDSYASVIWKSDGTIINDKGEIIKESYGTRFQKQLINPSKEWPKASGKGKNLENYFGNEIFIPGTPLLRMSSIDLNSNYLEKLAKLNDFESINDLQKFIIGNANYKFLNELNITEESAIIFISKDFIKSNLIDSNNENLSLLNEKLSDNFSEELEHQIDQKFKNKTKKVLQNNIENQVQEQLQSQVQEQVEQQIQEQVYESLTEYFDRLEEEYKAKGWTVCSRTEDSISASSSSDGCDYQ